MIFPTPNVTVEYGSTYAQLSSSYKKIYQEPSNALTALEANFIPYAQHILDFVVYWCTINPTYGYEIVCTRRSWDSQKKVTTIYDDEKNGLSWYLYGNAISINVYQMIPNQLFEGGDVGDVVHQALNFTDGSANAFILAAQEWFIENPVSINGTDRIIKIFGLYPSVSECTNTPLSDLFGRYVNDEDVVYWGGLFSGNSNFSHWEWHPGYQPNQIWIVRENFLNTAFNDIDLLSLMSEENQGVTFSKKYLPTYKEIIEEDFIALIKLKTKINLSKEYSILDLMNWAKDNPISLDQMILYYQLSGDYNTYALLGVIKSTYQSASINYDAQGNIQLNANGLLKISTNNDGTYSFEYYNEFSEKITLPSDTTYILPVDHKLIDIDFNITELNIDDDIKPVYSDTLTDVTMDQVITNINDTANQNPNILFDINEHGMLGDLSIMPEKVLTLDQLQKVAAKQYVFEERITPPNQIRTSNTSNSKIIDLNQVLATKNYKSNINVDEMINPSDLS